MCFCLQRLHAVAVRVHTLLLCQSCSHAVLAALWRAAHVRVTACTVTHTKTRIAQKQKMCFCLLRLHAVAVRVHTLLLCQSCSHAVCGSYHHAATLD